MGQLNFTGIRRRWLLSSMGIVGLLVVISISVFSVLISNYYYESLRSNVEQQARQTMYLIERFYSGTRDELYAGVIETINDHKRKDKMELQFIDEQGLIQMSSAGPAINIPPMTSDVQKCMATLEIEPFIGYDEMTDERVLSVSAPLLFEERRIIGVIRYVTSMEQVDRVIMRSIGFALLIGVAVMVFVAVVNLVFIRGIVLPIQEINKVTKRIASGSYGVRIENSYRDEIGELVENINNMSADINLSSRMKTDFMSSVSHELRTPLTAIAGWGETMLAADFNDPSELKKGVKIMLKEANRLTRLVEELLDFTRMEGGRMTLFSEPMNVVSELDEVVYMMAEAFNKDGIELLYEAEAELPIIIGDRARLKQVFFNILDNAAKHGREGNRIEVTVFAENDGICIKVRDFGQGIPPDELVHVRKKFYKGSTKTRGSGIGLAVADEIIRLHNGVLDIFSTVGEGTAILLHLPASKGTA